MVTNLSDIYTYGIPIHMFIGPQGRLVPIIKDMNARDWQYIKSLPYHATHVDLVFRLRGMLIGEHSFISAYYIHEWDLWGIIRKQVQREFVGRDLVGHFTIEYYPPQRFEPRLQVFFDPLPSAQVSVAFVESHPLIKNLEQITQEKVSIHFRR